MTGDEIREAFLSYFESRGHLRVASSSLIPVGDPTLLLTNAGMVQFKPYLAGESEPPNRRLTSSQKSFRTVDIDEVGDSTHLTLFEMLGNFSIGDYFKKEAIDFALEFVTKGLGLDQERFYATVYLDDDESFELWEQAGVPAERIYRFGDEDNWWGPAGLEGPCGPCSELHFDFGRDRGCGHADCAPNCTRVMNDEGDTCNRFVELWNLVFMQFYHHLDGSRPPLPAPSVDTGMGLERAVVIMQGVSTIYQTDLFTPLIRKVEELTGKSYGTDHGTDYAMHVVAEHGRSATFLIADGVVPGNEGRGYVLRRVIRRAIRHGWRLGLEGVFLGDIAQTAIEVMGDAYPEQRNHRDFILTVIKLEEERFQQAFQNGYAVLTDALVGVRTLPGEAVFRLWDTYGFPVEMTQEIAREQGIDVDLEGFEREMDAQRERARSGAGGKFGGDRAKIHVYESLGVGVTRFLGYEQTTASSVVVGLITGDQAVSEAARGQDVEVVLLETPFYPEGGGQIGDSGELSGPNGKIEVRDTQLVMPDLIVQFGTVTEGQVAVGDSVEAEVYPVRREDTARNHTATHLLHAALRQVLGSHVRQAGSLVTPDRLRFDFSHVQPVTEDEMWQVQSLVNEKIRQNVEIVRREETYTEAIRLGALAFFGDKYGDKVRLVEMDNGSPFSFEVCGGTHVEHTGEVGAVYVLGESSIGAGTRRIEAIGGRAAERLVWERFGRENSVAAKLQTTAPEIEGRVQSLLDELDGLRRQHAALERRVSLEAASELLDRKQDVDGVTVLAVRTVASSADSLREVGDWLRDKLGSGVVVLGSVLEDRPMLVAMVTPDLVKKGFDAREIARDAGKVIQGGGGGRPDVAQAGGKRADKLDEALSLVPELVREKSAAP